MPSISSTYQINGVIDTNQSVYKNIQKLANACGCWFTFDIHEGLWSVIINTTGSSVKSFDDTNIIGSINVSGKGVRELYNRVLVEFPHEDILDAKDFTEYSIDAGDLYPNEVTNTLNFSTELVAKPEHAQRLALMELKQSRVDKIINFRAGFDALGLKAGDLIDITSEMLDYTNKVFRITSIAEEDTDEGNILLNITALEYDADVYDYADVFRETRERANGIIVKTINDAVQQEEDKSLGQQLERLLLANVVTGLLNSVFSKNPTTGEITQTTSNTTVGQRTEDAFSDAERAEVLKNMAIPPVTITGPDEICENTTLTLTVAVDSCACLLDTSTYQFPYTITGVDAADITPFALTGRTLAGSVAIPIGNISADKTLTFTIDGTSKSVDIYNTKTFTYSVAATADPITEGSSTTINLTTTGIADSTTIPYEITGPGVGRVSTALTGTVTVTSNAASLTVNTTDDGVYQGTSSFTVTFDPDLVDPCGTVGNSSIEITLNDNDSPPVPTTSCEYVQVPLIWCATYNGTDDQMEGATVEKYAYLPKALAGEATVNVPKTLTITKGNPSTITVATTEAVASSAVLGGVPLQIITTFNTVAPLGLITGSATTTVYGYL